MYTSVLAVPDGPDVSRASLAAAAGLAALAALIIAAPWVADLADVSGPAHGTLLSGLTVVVGLGVLLAVVNGALGNGPSVALAPVVAPMLVVAAAMIAMPALGLSTPDTSPVGGLLLTAYFFGLAVAAGLGGFAVGRAGRWLVGPLAR